MGVHYITIVHMLHIRKIVLIISHILKSKTYSVKSHDFRILLSLSSRRALIASTAASNMLSSYKEHMYIMDMAIMTIIISHTHIVTWVSKVNNRSARSIVVFIKR